jgi:hypothetical protein
MIIEAESAKRVDLRGGAGRNLAQQIVDVPRPLIVAPLRPVPGTARMGR